MAVPLVVALVLLLTFTSWVGSVELRSWLMCQGDVKEEEDMSVDSDEEPQSYPITTPLSHQSKNMKPPPSKLKVSSAHCILLLASCLIYARALLEYVIFILWVRSFSKVLPSAKFVEDKVLV